MEAALNNKLSLSPITKPPQESNSKRRKWHDVTMLDE